MKIRWRIRKDSLGSKEVKGEDCLNYKRKDSWKESFNDRKKNRKEEEKKAIKGKKIS